jgi:tRNA dimethylallyltransferase
VDSTLGRRSRVTPSRPLSCTEGIDVADPTERYSASRWATDAKEWIVEAEVDRRVPLIVGGTGFYIRALFEPLFDAPQIDASRRALLGQWLDERPLTDLRRWCEVLDPDKAKLGRVQLRARSRPLSLQADA